MAKLIPAFLDFESFWSVEHSLTKMYPALYVMHPETELISLAYKIGDDQTFVLFGEDNIKEWAKSIDWTDKLVVGHNMSGFDSMICRWRLGIKPAMWGCTLAMSRPLHALDVGGSLGKLVAHYGLGVKDQTALINTKGRHLKDFTFDERAAMEEYNKADTEQCAALFKIFLPQTPKKEMKLIDATVRMLVEPKFVVDRDLLTSTLISEKAKKREMLIGLAAEFGADANDDEDFAAEMVRMNLASAGKFAAFLESKGVEVPMKASPSNPEKLTYALAKTDQDFLDLQEHEDPVVSAAALARLGVKSTLLETRITAFLDVSARVKGRLPVPLRYYGGHTGRWSGEQYNPQNLPRVTGNKPSDCLRNSLQALPGYKVVVADLSGIELRVNHFLWQVPSSMELYQADPEKADLYKDFAAMLYNKAVTDVTKDERQIGKVAHLGLGFSAGYKTFVRIAKMMGGVDITEDESMEVVGKWRDAYGEIVQGWKTCQRSLAAIVRGAKTEIDPWGLVVTDGDGFVLPSGRKIRYPDLRQEETNNGKAWMYGQGRNKVFLSGGKCDENIVQALARDVIADNMLQVHKLTGKWPALTVHDELVYVVPEAEAPAHLDLVQSVMRTPPTWWPELVVWSAGDIANTYGASK